MAAIATIKPTPLLRFTAKIAPSPVRSAFASCRRPMPASVLRAPSSPPRSIQRQQADHQFRRRLSASLRASMPCRPAWTLPPKSRSSLFTTRDSHRAAEPCRKARSASQSASAVTIARSRAALTVIESRLCFDGRNHRRSPSRHRRRRLASRRHRHSRLASVVERTCQAGHRCQRGRRYRFYGSSRLRRRLPAPRRHIESWRRSSSRASAGHAFAVGFALPAEKAFPTSSAICALTPTPILAAREPRTPAPHPRRTAARSHYASSRRMAAQTRTASATATPSPSSSPAARGC